MTKTEALNKAAQEFGYADYEMANSSAVYADMDKIIHRAMDIYAGGWISVEERLPEENCDVLIYFGTDIVQAYLKGGYWKGSSLVTDSMNDGFVTDRRICKQGDVFDFVTHWQPLPTAP